LPPERPRVGPAGQVEERNHADHDLYLGHVMWCCHADQPAFEGFGLTDGPFSPRRDWRTATGRGADTMCG
jgi:hypothetical protein